MSFPNANVKSAVLSPSLNEYSKSQFTDESGNVLDMIAAIPVDANGNATLGTAVLQAGKVSQVTGRPEGAQVVTPAGEKIPLLALVGLNSVGAPVPFKPLSAGAADTAAVAALATKVTGKFQSAPVTATGSSQNVAHGLGVVPTLVLIAAYDNTAAGSTPFAFSIEEGAHDSTNVKVTATVGLVFKVIAFA